MIVHNAVSKYSHLHFRYCTFQVIEEVTFSYIAGENWVSIITTIHIAHLHAPSLCSLEMLPPFGPNLTPFRPANPVVFNLYIAGLSRKDILTTQKEKIQDISEKLVEILIPK